MRATDRVDTLIRRGAVRRTRDGRNDCLAGLGYLALATVAARSADRWERRPHLAVSAALALPVEKALEVGVKKVTDRRRPAKDVPDARLRDDAPTDGPSYPSGHAGIAYAAVTLAAPYLPPLGTTAVATAATLATVTRIHQGAHFPLDAVGGALLGVAVGSGLNAVFGLPSAARSA